MKDNFDRRAFNALLAGIGTLLLIPIAIIALPIAVSAFVYSETDK